MIGFRNKHWDCFAAEEMERQAAAAEALANGWLTRVASLVHT